MFGQYSDESKEQINHLREQNCQHTCLTKQVLLFSLLIAVLILSP